MGSELAPPAVISLDSPPADLEENIVTMSTPGVERMVEVGAASQSHKNVAVVAVHSEALVADNTGRPVGVENRSPSAVFVTSSVPSSSTVVRVPPSAAEKGKSVEVDDYESKSNLDPDDVRMFEEGIAHSVFTWGGVSPCSPQKGDNMVPQFSLLCSKAENEFLRNIFDAELSDEVVVMGLRVFYL